MSWDEHDLLGDLEEDIPHEYFYTDFIKRPNEYVNDDVADEYYPEEEEEEYDMDMLEDYLSVEDIDFSNLDGVDLKEDLNRISDAVSGRRVLGREYEDYSSFDLEDYATTYRKPRPKPTPIKRKSIERPIAKKPVQRTTERPIARKPASRPIVRKPAQRPIVRKPAQRPIARKPAECPTERPIARKPAQRPTQRPTPQPLVRKSGEQRPMVKKPLSRPTPSVNPQLRATNPISQVQRQRPTVTAKGTVNPTTNKRPRPTNQNCENTKRIIVPQDRKVIVEGVDKFILSNTKESDAIKNIGYYKGEKCSELILIINNTTPNDFEFELFNPSMPLDYLFSSSQDLNARILVAGSNKVSYSDVLFNLLANPTILPNAKFIVTNPTDEAQKNLQFNQSLIFKNKNIAGNEVIRPVYNALNIDVDQTQNEIIYWDIQQTLGRVYIPDGMDVISYKVLAGNTVTFAFYYKQISLKKFFFKEARNKTIL
jgi:hypothetical protein